MVQLLFARSASNITNARTACLWSYANHVHSNNAIPLAARDLEIASPGVSHPLLACSLNWVPISAASLCALPGYNLAILPSLNKRKIAEYLYLSGTLPAMICYCSRNSLPSGGSYVTLGRSWTARKQSTQARDPDKNHPVRGIERRARGSMLRDK